MKNISTILGWIGTFAYLLAYLLLSLNKMKSQGVAYHLLNIIGALGLVCNAIFLNDYPNLMVNICWALIAIMAIILIVRKRQN